MSGIVAIGPGFKPYAERLVDLYERQYDVMRRMAEAEADLVSELPLPPMNTYVIGQMGTRMVKIGKTVNVPSRLRELQTGNPNRLRVMRVIPFDCERRMHMRFAHLRRSGEWFEFRREMLVERFNHDIVKLAQDMCEEAQ